MHKWGILVSIFYALILLGLIVPGFALLAERFSGWPNYFQTLREAYGAGVVWVPVGIFISSQALLLFLSVDTSQRRLKPRAHILVSCSVAAFLTELLTAAGIWSIGFAAGGTAFGRTYFPRDATVLGFCGALWLLWGILFYLYLRDSPAVVTWL